jgi:hypothetical protein
MDSTLALLPLAAVFLLLSPRQIVYLTLSLLFFSGGVVVEVDE